MIELVTPPKETGANTSAIDDSVPTGLEDCYAAFQECQSLLAHEDENESLEAEVHEEWEKALRAYEALKSGIAARREAAEKELRSVEEQERNVGYDPQAHERFRLANIASDIHQALENLYEVEGSLNGTGPLMDRWYRGVQTGESQYICDPINDWGVSHVQTISSARERLEELARS